MHTSIEGRADFGPLFPRDLIEGGATVMASSAADMIFDRVKTQLKARIGAEVFSSWFARMKLAESSKGVVRLSVPTAFLRSWINSHYLDAARRTVEAGGARPAEGRDRRAHDDEAGARRARTRAAGGPKGRAPPADRAGHGHAVARALGAAAAGQRNGEPARPSAERARLAARPALHVPVVHRRAVQPRRLRSGARGRRTVVERALQSAVPACDRRPRQDASAAGHRRGIAQAEPAGPRRLPDRRILHVALRHRDPRQQRADLEGAAARHRPADHRRHAVPAGQVDPERVLPPDQHAARQRQAGGGGGRPAAGRAGIARAARALAPQRRRRAGNVGAGLHDAARHAEAAPAARAGRGCDASASKRRSWCMSPAP